ncbi:15-hydroxyprostaglandin dehydrogenase [NAD(+)]-like [Anneissia japonica]|uniref:15-hydroxyprostaglandin dehydrogenase [NAD(+)]-like n=1 Tax=Anneissia japonica TaxID=1529436 RepID=UPI001425A318|nr:15-hydroxyprostaglandin dehydrogenase [NAD(+)]-like [Anneissia japonica]
MELSGKVALITGAAEGLGRAFAEELLKKQIKGVGILDIQKTKGEATLKQLANEYGEEKVHFIQCDVTDKQQFEGAFSEVQNRFGQIDIVCNNAGIGGEDNWEKLVEVNLIAVIRGTHLAIKYMSKANGGTGGVIVNMASMAGLRGVQFCPVYSATKHGVIGLTRSLAVRYFDNTIAINRRRPTRWVSIVAEAFMKLVEEDRDGQIMRKWNSLRGSSEGNCKEANMEVSGKVALITGAAEGLGRAFAEELLKKQIKAVGILDIQKSKGEATLKELANEYGNEKVHFIHCDVSDKQQLEDAFSEIKNQFGQIDLVCNNAGIANEANWEKMVEINLIAVIRGSHLAIKYMSKANGGRGGVIVNIASLAGLRDVPFCPVYAASKHGVVGLSRSLAASPMLKSDSIRLNALCPSYTDTALITPETKEFLSKLLSNFNVQPVSIVVEAFMKLVEEGRDGQVMRVTHTNGIDLQEYEEIPI